MDEEPNPIKDFLYETISELGEKNIQKIIVNGNNSEAINKILSNSKNKIDKLNGRRDYNMAILLTSLLHYFLALVLIPSQRKISKNNIDIDIVIPNLKTLETNPKNSIVICIPEAHDLNINQQISLMKSIQPNNENIWYVTEKQLDQKTYSIHNETILKIIDDINEFLASKNDTQFRFFKA